MLIALTGYSEEQLRQLGILDEGDESPGDDCVSAAPDDDWDDKD